MRRAAVPRLLVQDGAAGEGGVGDGGQARLGGDQKQEETGRTAGKGETGHENPKVSDLVRKEAGERRSDHVRCRNHSVDNGNLFRGEAEAAHVDHQVGVEDDQAGGLEEEDELDPDEVRLGEVLPHPLPHLPQPGGQGSWEQVATCRPPRLASAASSSCTGRFLITQLASLTIFP